MPAGDAGDAGYAGDDGPSGERLAKSAKPARLPYKAPPHPVATIRAAAVLKFRAKRCAASEADSKSFQPSACLSVCFALRRRHRRGRLMAQEPPFLAGGIEGWHALGSLKIYWICCQEWD